MRHLQPKIDGREMPSTARYIGQADMTLFEREWQKGAPTNSYAIRDSWDDEDRDFVAFWKVQAHKLIAEFGRHDIKPVTEEIYRWLQPILRGDIAPKSAPDDSWQEYRDAQAVLWEGLSEGERDAIRGITKAQKADREAFESMTPEERAEHERAVRASGSYYSTRKHIDGRILDERGNTVGRWKEPEGSILDKVKGWAAETHHGPAHVERWRAAANGIEPGTFSGVRAMTAKEASGYETRFMKSRWGPTARAIRDREINFTRDRQTVDAELEETLKSVNERPDVEVRKYNPDTNEFDVLSPATAAQPSTIAPDHVDRFCEWLERERDLVAKECGTGHPAISCTVYEGYIEDVREGCRVHSQIMFCYDQFIGWLRGEYGQRTVDETTLWADGREDDHSEAAFKAKQAAYAEEVKEFQKARDSGHPEAQQGFDHWALRDSPERKAARDQVTQQKALREAIPGDNDALAKRTQEILAKAAKGAPTPADIEAAVKAGDWHKVAELAKAQAKAQVPPEGYVWFGWIRQGSVASGQYICIGDGEYEEAILYLASDFGGRELRPRLYQQNALNGPCRVRHSHDWNDCCREGPFLKTWDEIRAEYGNI